ncbi:MAG: GNAT family N-acetyltransferase, partial [Firmicutes bacterium]|nr:GNAT family N-acetyltransferase [Bacillota bacterium]
ANEKGIRAYKKAGFVEEGRLRADRYLRGAYGDTLVMGVLRSEWEAGRGGTAGLGGAADGEAGGRVS